MRSKEKVRPPTSPQFVLHLTFFIHEPSGTLPATRDLLIPSNVCFKAPLFIVIRHSDLTLPNVYMPLTFFSCHSLSPVPFAFVVFKESATENQHAVVEDLRHLVATKIAKYAVPDHFLVKAITFFTEPCCTALTLDLYYSYIIYKRSIMTDHRHFLFENHCQCKSLEDLFCQLLKHLFSLI